MKKRLMAITFAALMATSMMGSTVFAATDGGSVAGKTSLADADFDTDYQPQKDEYKIYCTYKNIHSWYDAIKTGVDAAVADLKDIRIYTYVNYFICSLIKYLSLIISLG